MKVKDREKTVFSKWKAGGKSHLPFFVIKQCANFIFLTLIMMSVYFMITMNDDRGYIVKKEIDTQSEISQEQIKESEGENDSKEENLVKTSVEIADPVMLPEYQSLYEENEDIIGWLKIDDTNIDYPVMQTIEDEDYYLRRDFYGNDNENGCLILDTDSVAGIGTIETEYAGGIKPSTNLIIHGHTMKSGAMFGKLKLYTDREYGLSHNIIYFDSLYEKREYELIAVFYSQVFYKSENVFKYYNFFQADTKDEFNDWYENIMKLSLYDTGVTAEYGDEFITLSCCSYHVEDGRLVVVGRRVK